MAQEIVWLACPQCGESLAFAADSAEFARIKHFDIEPRPVGRLTRLLGLRVRRETAHSIQPYVLYRV